MSLGLAACERAQRGIHQLEVEATKYVNYKNAQLARKNAELERQGEELAVTQQELRDVRALLERTVQERDEALQLVVIRTHERDSALQSHERR